MRLPFTKQPRFLGLPVGPPETDWRRLGKYAAMGVGAISTAVGSVGAKRVGSRLKDEASEGAQGAKDTVKEVGKAAGKVSELGESLPGGGGGDGEGDDHVKKLRLIIKESIDVGVPLKTAYNQWTQFAEMPSIMGSVQNVDQESDDETRWVVKIGPSRRRWTAKIVEQNPDERIAWESTDGTENRGAVTFHRLDRNLTRIQVEMQYFPNGPVEKIGNFFLAARRRTRKDLRLFKHFLELAGSETGAWRGEISVEDSAAGGEEKSAEESGSENEDSGDDREESRAEDEKEQEPSKA